MCHNCAGDIIEEQGIFYLLTVMIDVTESKQAQEALANRTRWFLIGLGVFILALLMLVTRLIVGLRQRKVDAEKLRKSEESFRFLVDYSSDLIWKLRGDAVLEYVSPSWKTVLGYDPDFLMGKDFRPFVHPDDVMACVGYMGKVLDAKKRLPGPQYRVKHTDGSYHWHEGIITPVFPVISLIGREPNRSF